MRRRSPPLLLLILLLDALRVMPAHALQSEPGAELTVYVATVGQGSLVWEKFGHNALWIHDRNTGSTISYNYGIFDFAQPGFVPRLMTGRMLYSMDARSADAELAHYTYSDRTVWVQQLNMTAAQKHALREFLEWNWLPENRDYVYDYFRDNCSTRVRDALDRALDGAIAGTLRGLETGTSYRWHSLRLTGADLPTYAGLLLGLGQPTDDPIDAWEEGFIPMQLMAHLRQVRVPDESGALVPLVAEERTLYQSPRAAEAAAPPNRTAQFLLVGLVLAAALAWLTRRSGRSPRAALGLAIGISLWGIITGFFGLLLFLLWAATDHATSYWNFNLLQVSPLGFLLGVAAPLALAARRGGRAGRAARWALVLALVALALSALGLLLRLLPGIYQVNEPIIALVLPVHAAVVYALYPRRRAHPSSVEDNSDRISVPAAA